MKRSFLKSIESRLKEPSIFQQLVNDLRTAGLNVITADYQGKKLACEINNAEDMLALGYILGERKDGKYHFKKKEIYIPLFFKGKRKYGHCKPMDSTYGDILCIFENIKWEGVPKYF